MCLEIYGEGKWKKEVERPFHCPLVIDHKNDKITIWFKCSFGHENIMEDVKLRMGFPIYLPCSKCNVHKQEGI